MFIIKYKKVVVDYLNIYTILFLLFYRSSSVIVLYKHAFLDNFYKFFVTLIGIRVVESLCMSNDNNGTFIYMKTKDEKKRIIESNFSSPEYFSDFIHKEFYYRYLHHFSELCFLLKNEEFDVVLTNYPNYLAGLKIDNVFYSKIRCYLLPSFIHKEYRKNLYKYRGLYFYKCKDFFTNVKIFIKTVLFVKLNNGAFIKADLLTCVTPVLNPYANSSKFTEDERINCVELDPYSLILKKKYKTQHLYSIKIFEIFEIFRKILKIYRSISKKSYSSFILFVYKLTYAKQIFFLDKFIEKSGVNTTYTCHANAKLNIARMLDLFGRSNKNIVTTSTTVSLNYFPELLTATDKYSDVFFAWGDWHKDLQLKSCSFRCPETIILSGYVFDYSVQKMSESCNSLIKKTPSFKNKKIISVYDNVVFMDSHITYTHINNFYYGLILFLNNNLDYNCIIKSKKSIFKKLVNSDILTKLDFLESRIMYMDRHSDIGPAMSSDIVYALSMSTLGNIASILGRKVFLYDEGLIISRDYLSKNVAVVTSVNDFLEKVGNFPIYKNRDNSRIDPFIDGKAQNRIFEYVYDLLTNATSDKKDRIYIANHNYYKNYGKDKVFEIDYHSHS